MILLTLVDMGDTTEDIAEIYGVALDDDDDNEWKLVEFSCYNCSWAQRYEVSDNFNEFYNEFKSHTQYVAEDVGNMLLEEARDMGNRLIKRHVSEMEEYELRREEERLQEERDAALKAASNASIGDEFDVAMSNKIISVYNDNVGKDTKKCVSAIKLINNVSWVSREERGMCVNDLHVVVHKPGEGFEREYYISYCPAAIIRVRAE